MECFGEDLIYIPLKDKMISKAFNNKGSRTSHQHHGEEDDEQVGVVPKGEVSLHTHILAQR